MSGTMEPSRNAPRGIGIGRARRRSAAVMIKCDGVFTVAQHKPLGHTEREENA